MNTEYTFDLFSLSYIRYIIFSYTEWRDALV